MAEIEPVVRAVGLTKVFRDFWGRPKARAVNDIDFEIRPGADRWSSMRYWHC